MARTSNHPIVRTSITLPENLWLVLVDFRFNNRTASMSAAIEQLIVAGLANEGLVVNNGTAQTP